MIFKASVDLSAWIRDFEVEAPSEEEAKKKLAEMTFDDIVDQLSYESEGFVGASEMDDVDLECVEKTLKIKVSDLKCVDEDGDEVSPAESEYAFDVYFREDDDDDLEDLVKDELSYRSGVDEERIRSFKYEVVEER